MNKTSRQWLIRYLLIAVWAVFAAAQLAAAAEPADPNLIPEARKLLDYLESVQGKRLLTGISGCLDSQPRTVLHMTGREPAISGDDVAGFHRKWDETYRKVLQGTVDKANQWWHVKGGIVTLHCHWMKPGNPEGSAWVGGGRGTGKLDLAKAITPGTEEHRAVMADLSVTADYLKQLADARVPVLWRPLHEIDGSWFWWTDAETPENTAALWRLMFDYFVSERKLHNLIWVYNAAHVTHGWKRADGTLDEEVAHRKRFYPGAKYVDIASIDTYANPKLGWGASWEDARRPAYELMQQVAPGKMLAIAEDSALLNPDIAQKDGPGWLYCLAWWTGGKSNPVEWMRETFNHEHMLTLDELPLLVEGNVMPNVRITQPADGAELCGTAGAVAGSGAVADLPPIHPSAVAGLRPSHGAGPQVSRNAGAGDLTVAGAAGSETRAEREEARAEREAAETRAGLVLSGFATDRNTNLQKVTIHALPAPWRNWFLRNDPDVIGAFPDSTSLGEARLAPDGRWTFTWQNAPAGFYSVVALARDADGLIACSNVIRLTVGLKNLAQGCEVTASSISKHGEPAEAAVDGDPNTMWWSDKDQPDPQWLMVDLGTERKVGGVSVAWWKAYGKSYAVQVSTDGQTWREAATVQGRNLWHGDADVLRFEPV
ncbi:MAG: discoidin domain-containing protein, partial [Pirellulaceae bacterium]|nr:discoidin domain-containing protein [Pirellulaceae bacterium]